MQALGSPSHPAQDPCPCCIFLCLPPPWLSDHILSAEEGNTQKSVMSYHIQTSGNIAGGEKKKKTQNKTGPFCFCFLPVKI